MKILFLTHSDPFPARLGGEVYTSNILRRLGAAPGVELTVLCFAGRQPAHLEPAGVRWERLPFPRWLGWQARLGQLRHVVILPVRGGFRRRLLDLLHGQRWDLVVVDYIAIGPAVRTVRAAGAATPVVYLSHNVESVLQRDIAAGYRRAPVRYAAARYDLWRVSRLERLLLARSAAVTAETDQDAAQLRRLHPGRVVITLRPGYDGARVASKDFAATRPDSVLVLGGRQAPMKQAVLDELLRRAEPGCAERGVRIVVAGRMPPRYRRRVSRAHPSVELLGYVPDAGALLTRFRLALVVDHVGGGFKHRILTLVFHRIPLIARADAMAGLPLTPGVDYLAVTDYADVPAAARAGLDQPAAALAGLADRAFTRCAEAFDWQRNVDSFLDLARALSRPAAG